MGRITTYYSNRRPAPPTRAVQFPFTLYSSKGELTPPQSSFTIETWFKLTAWANLRNTTFGASIGSEREQALFIGAGEAGYSFLCKTVNNGSGMGALHFMNYIGNTLESPPVVKPQQWIHLRFSYDVATQNGVIYADNVAIAAGTLGSPLRPLGTLNVGHVDSYRTFRNVNGLMDETRVWPYVRSDAQNSASWQKPNKELPDLAAAAAAWDYEDPMPIDKSSWKGFADGSGHGQTLLSSTNSFEGDQAISTAPFV